MAELKGPYMYIYTLVLKSAIMDDTVCRRKVDCNMGGAGSTVAPDQRPHQVKSMVLIRLSTGTWKGLR